MSANFEGSGLTENRAPYNRDCPDCGARVGKDCRKGGRIIAAHNARYDLPLAPFKFEQDAS